jgi:hypothetical protein
LILFVSSVADHLRGVAGGHNQDQNDEADE